jgi:peptide subunit release factor 1 (eRF1)
MVEEIEYQCSTKVFQDQVGRILAQLSLRKSEEELKGIPIGGNRVSADRLLLAEVFDEELLKQTRK